MIKKRRDRKTIGLKKIIASIWVIILLLVLILYFGMQSVILKRVTKQVEQNIKLQITNTEKKLDEIMTMTDQYIFELYYTDSMFSVSSFIYNIYHGDELTSNNAKYDLTKLITGIRSWSNKIDFVTAYIEAEDSTWYESGDTDNYIIRQQIKEYFQQGIWKKQSLGDSPYIFVKDKYGKGYLLRIMRLDNAVFVLGINEDTVIDAIMKETINDDGVIFALGLEGEILFCTDNDVVNNVRLSVENDGEYVTIGNEHFFQCGSISETSGFYMGTLIPRESITKEINSIRVIFILVLSLLIVLLAMEILLLDYKVQRPLKNMLIGMKTLEQGDFDTLLTYESIITEFIQLRDSFNHMVQRIQRLKIEKYEAEIEVQKSSLQYLSLQIRPHFYANALNIIYSLAQTRDFEGIQKLSQAIVAYSRYIFRDATDLVELKKECEHVNNYMDIQQIRYSQQMKIVWDISENIESALIPPLIIQSFVENSVKYAFSSRKENVIYVRAKYEEEEDVLKITIKDEGLGYPESMLDGKWKNTKIESHIGLQNSYKRLRIIFDDSKADIVLRNDNGAVAEITLPFISMEDVEIDIDID